MLKDRIITFRLYNWLLYWTRSPDLHSSQMLVVALGYPVAYSLTCHLKLEELFQKLCSEILLDSVKLAKMRVYILLMTNQQLIVF